MANKIAIVSSFVPVDKISAAKSGGLLFRRYRKSRSGKILDAYEYGYKAWPIKR